MISFSLLSQQLVNLGILPGSVCLVHCAFSKVGPVEHGPGGLIAALEAAVGPAGTLVMPSMTDDDDHVFDPRTTPCRSLGVVADTFWRSPGARRSANPHAFAAKGPAAEYITSPHPLDFPHGPDSPIGRVHELNGWVVLLGVGHDADTTVHLAEAIAGVRYRRPKHVTILHQGRPTALHYKEIDHCCENFRLVDTWLSAEGKQRRGTVGRSIARLARSRDVVATVLAQLHRDQTVFLHPRGVDSQCDEAWQSLGAVA